MLRKLVVGILLVVVGITVPLAQAGTAGGMPVFTPGQLHTQYEAANNRASCTTLAQKTTTRSDVALLALTKSAQAYAKAHNASAPEMDALLQSPDTRAEIMSGAVKLYRSYLAYLGHRLIISRSADCTRSVVAFVDGSGLHIVAEEELAQAATGPLELTPGVGGGSAPSPVNLSDGVNQASDCCTGFFNSPNTLWGWGMAEIMLGLSILGLPSIALTGTTPTFGQVMGALIAGGKGLMDLERAIEQGAGGGSAGNREGPQGPGG